MLSRRHRTIRQELGATAIEYALMIALIGAVLVATVMVAGVRIDAIFRAIVTTLGG